MIKALKITDAVTFLNIALAMPAMICAITGKMGIAAILMLVSVVFDYSDGAWSRRLNIANEFGREFDSMVDVISFGVTPAIFVFSIYHDANYVIIYVLFLAAGAMRLARYNLAKTGDYFQGMPITLNGVFVPILYYCGAHPLLMHGYLIASAALMVSSIRVPKLRFFGKKEADKEV